MFVRHLYNGIPVPKATYQDGFDFDQKRADPDGDTVSGQTPFPLTECRLSALGSGKCDQENMIMGNDQETVQQGKSLKKRFSQKIEQVARKTLLNSVNGFLDLFTGGEKRPAFFDIDKTYPRLRVFDRNYAVIKKELATILPQKANLPRYHDLDKYQKRISGTVDTEKDWKIFYLNGMGIKATENCRQCPETARLIDTIPHVFQAFFSILDGGKSIPEHKGPYRGFLRYHLALKVPEENPPKIRVKDEYYTWKEGESMLFDDSFEHEVYNQCNDIRVVLIVDVMRPLPIFARQVNLMYRLFARRLYAKGVLKLTN